MNAYRSVQHQTFSDELDEETMDLITSYDSYPSKWTTNNNNFIPSYGFSHQVSHHPHQRSPSSVVSSLESASPSSTAAFDPEDSGMDANTNMSTCTSYLSVGDNTTTTGFSSVNSSPNNTVNSFSQFMCQSSGSSSFQRSFTSPIHSDSHGESTTASPFRSPSNSFGTGQRPRITFSNSHAFLGQSTVSGLQTQQIVKSSGQFVSDEEATQMEYPGLEGSINSSSTSPTNHSHLLSLSSVPNAVSIKSHDQEPRNLPGEQLNDGTTGCVGGVFQSSCSATDPSLHPQLRLLSQPCKNHRARYRTEGSRGAVKDRTGRSFPVIKLSGYSSPNRVKVRCFIGSDKNPGESHLYYQVSKIVGKNITPCSVIKVDGIKMIEMDLVPENGFGLVVNCVGIVKERNFDVQRKTHGIGGTKRKSGMSTVEEDQVMAQTQDKVKQEETRRQQQASTPLSKRSTACNLVFTCTIPVGSSGQLQTIQVVSEGINCAQILGSPEIHKISQTRDFFEGGNEVFIIGKNFTRDAKVLWDFGPVSLVGQSVMRESDPESDFMNQNHLIFKVPLLKTLLDDSVSGDETNVLTSLIRSQTNNSNITSIPVSLRIRCGDKVSDAVLFTFIRVNSSNNRNMSGDLNPNPTSGLNDAQLDPLQVHPVQQQNVEHNVVQRSLYD